MGVTAFGAYPGAAYGGPDPEAAMYVQDLLNRLSVNKERLEDELRAFLGRVVRYEFNWTAIIDAAVAPNEPTAEHYRKIGPWLIDYISNHKEVLGYLANRVPGNCQVVGSDGDREGLSVWAECQVTGEKTDQEYKKTKARFQLKKLHNFYQITDLEYGSESLLRTLTTAMTKESAIRQHGVRLLEAKK